MTHCGKLVSTLYSFEVYNYNAVTWIGLHKHIKNCFCKIILIFIKMFLDTHTADVNDKYEVTVY